jgi:hypothetical protein
VSTEIMNWAGIQSGKQTFLCVQVGERYVEWLNHWKLKENGRFMQKYIFAYIFEYSHIAGESGIHRYISEITVGEEGKSPLGSRIWPISAGLTITLKEYDEMRSNRSFPKGSNPRPMPEYQRIEQ